MTKGPTSLDNFVEANDKLSLIADMSEKRKDRRANILEKAKKDLKNFAFGEYATYVGSKIEPFLSWEAVANPSELSREQEKELIEFTAHTNSKNSANLLTKKADEIAASISNDRLEYLVLTSDEKGKPIMIDYVKTKEDKKVFDSYHDFRGLKEMSERFGKGDRSEGIMKVVEGAIVAGLRKTTEESLKKAGYDSDVQELGVGLALSALKRKEIARENIDRYAKDGFKEIVAEAKSEYDSSIINKRDIYAVMKDALVEGSKAKSAKDFSRVENALYAACKSAN